MVLTTLLGSIPCAGRPHRVTHVQYGKTYRPVACEDCGCPRKCKRG